MLSGEVTKEPLRTLAAMKNRNFNFGVHSKPEFGPNQTFVINVGDKVHYQNE